MVRTHAKYRWLTLAIFSTISALVFLISTTVICQERGDENVYKKICINQKEFFEHLAKIAKNDHNFYICARSETKILVNAFDFGKHKLYLNWGKWDNISEEGGISSSEYESDFADIQIIQYCKYHCPDILSNISEHSLLIQMKKWSIFNNRKIQYCYFFVLRERLYFLRSEETCSTHLFVAMKRFFFGSILTSRAVGGHE